MRWCQVLRKAFAHHALLMRCVLVCLDLDHLSHYISLCVWPFARAGAVFPTSTRFASFQTGKVLDLDEEFSCKHARASGAQACLTHLARFLHSGCIHVCCSFKAESSSLEEPPRKLRADCLHLPHGNRQRRLRLLLQCNPLSFAVAQHPAGNLNDVVIRVSEKE